MTLQTEAPEVPSIGKISIWPPVILAPMAGVTDVPFRSLCRSFMDQGLADSSRDSVKPNHAPGLFVNQMITARAFVEENKKTMKLAEFGENESPRSIQLFAPGVPSIGKISIWPPVILAPMAGVTDVPFRSLCRSFMDQGLADSSRDSVKPNHAPGLFVNQMITARAFVEENKKTMKLAEFGENESPRSIQLYGTEPISIKEAVQKLVASKYVEHIDLNFGCPVPKVTRHGGGGALPYKQNLFRKIIKSAVGAAKDEIPITVKFRMGIDDNHLTYLTAGKIAEEEGASAISLHARTVKQLYSGQADWVAIRKLKEHIKTIPVFGNGDIWEAHDAIEMMRVSNADGVVIGRGCLGRPWLFKQLGEIFSGKEASQFPTLGEVGDAMLAHAKAVVEWNGSQTALRTFRKHASWYLTGFAVGKDIRREIQQINSLDDLTSIIDNFDAELSLPLDAYRIPRSHTGGPKDVSLPDGWLENPYEDFELSELAGQFASGG